MSTVEEQQDSSDGGLNFQDFIYFIFGLLKKARSEATDKAVFSAMTRQVILTLCVTLMAGAAEMGIMSDESDEILDDEPPKDEAVKAFIKDIYRNYKALEEMGSD